METIDFASLCSMLRSAAQQIRNNHEHLSELDSFGGDGDHGTTMLRAMENLETAVEAAQSHQKMNNMLSEVAWAVMGTDGGCTGPLFGSFFMGMSSATPEEEAIYAPTLAAMFSAGLASLQKQTKAQVGDKTIIDALVPAVTETEKAAAAGADIVELLDKAACAASVAADSTRQLSARFGRAKNAGTQSIGHADPGAVSASLLFKGFLEGIQ